MLHFAETGLLCLEKYLVVDFVVAVALFNFRSACRGKYENKSTILSEFLWFSVEIERGGGFRVNGLPFCSSFILSTQNLGKLSLPP